MEVHVHLCGVVDLLMCMDFNWVMVIREEVMAKTIEGLSGEVIDIAVMGEDNNLLIRTKSGKNVIIDGENLKYKVTQGAVEKEQTLEELQKQLLADWQQAYDAFVGAFDTPIQRRKMADEYSADARQRLRNFSDKLKLVAEMRRDQLAPLAEQVKTELKNMFSRGGVDL